MEWWNVEISVIPTFHFYFTGKLISDLKFDNFSHKKYKLGF